MKPGNPVNLLVVLFFLIFTSCLPDKFDSEKKINLVFDTDFGPDYDDVGALAIIHALADSGEVNLLATIASTKYDNVGPVLDAFNTFFNSPDTPVGVPQGSALTARDRQHWSDSIRANYPHDIRSNNETNGAVDLYREILASQPDTSVTIVTTGFLTNISNLLKSMPDQNSSLPGMELVTRKVRRLVCMAGAFPSGKEYNALMDSTASKYAFDHWPTEIIFSGVEVGSKIRTGLPLIRNKNIRNNPVKDVFKISIPQAAEDSLGRMSWDETAVLVAICGASPYFRKVKGRILTHKDGSNAWDPNGSGHFYLVPDRSISEIEDLLNGLMMYMPAKSQN